MLSRAMAADVPAAAWGCQDGACQDGPCQDGPCQDGPLKPARTPDGASVGARAGRTLGCLPPMDQRRPGAGGLKSLLDGLDLLACLFDETFRFQSQFALGHDHPACIAI